MDAAAEAAEGGCMNCYQCAEKEKCPLRTDPDMRKLFRCKYAEDAEDEQQAENQYRDELNRIAEMYGD